MGGSVQPPAAGEPAGAEADDRTVTEDSDNGVVGVFRVSADFQLQSRPVRVRGEEEIGRPGTLQHQLRRIRPVRRAGVQGPVPRDLHQAAKGRVVVRTGGEHSAPRD